MVPRRVDAIDWSTWTAQDTATLVFVVDGERVLLIRKKRGLGAGKINGPGGKLEPGETPEQCAVREVREEVGVTPKELVHMGEQRFQFIDGYAIHVHVYRADAHEGEPRETDEAVPFWFDVDRIPYQEMWEDDELWLPLVFAGTRFDGCYVFDDDRMLDHELVIG